MSKPSASVTRARILDLSVPLFAELGFDGVAMRAVASRCQLSATALYYHFSNKEQLYQAVVQYAVFARLLPNISLKTRGNRWVDLERFVVNLVKLLARDRDLQRLLQWSLLDQNQNRVKTLTDTAFAPFYERVTPLVEELLPQWQGHFAVTAIFGLILFPFQTQLVRQHLPGYLDPVEQPQQLAAQILLVLKSSITDQQR